MEKGLKEERKFAVDGPGEKSPVVKAVVKEDEVRMCILVAGDGEDEKVLLTDEFAAVKARYDIMSIDSLSGMFDVNLKRESLYVKVLGAEDKAVICEMRF